MSPTKTNGSVPGRDIPERIHRLEVTLAVVLFLAGLAAFAAFLQTLRGDIPSRLAPFTVFALLFLPVPALSVSRWSTGTGARLAHARFRGAGLLCIVFLAVYTAYAGVAGTGQFTFLWKFPLYAFAPLLLASAIGSSDPLRRPFLLGSTIVALWIPLEAGWVRGLVLSAGDGNGVDLTHLAAFDLALLLFVALVPVRDLGYTYRLRVSDIKRAGTAFVLFAAIAIPLGLALGFLRYGWQPFRPARWAVLLLNLYFLVAIPEEFLFRGLLQNLLEKTWRGKAPAAAPLLLASVIFGVSHINNPPAPNLRYGALAALAGLAYGWAWMRTRRITASALTHAAVDFLWIVALRGG
jgi:membrane protease YdiL (CAAX protease family)